MTEYTVKQFARKEQVTTRTVWNWIYKGALEIRRTPGVGVRIVDRSTVVVLDMKSVEGERNPSS